MVHVTGIRIMRGDWNGGVAVTGMVDTGMVEYIQSLEWWSIVNGVVYNNWGVWSHNLTT